MINEIRHKKYLDIERFTNDLAFGFSAGDDIVIEEKIDGANASFLYDEASDSIVAFSRNYQIDGENDLRGFWGWTQSLDKELVKRVIGSSKKVFGEWLVPHTVQYPEECYQKFYCFDVWDIEHNKYLTQNEAMEIAEALGLTFVPVFYSGKFTSWKTIQEYVGKTALGGAEGEGIVVKNMTSLNNDEIRGVFYTKLVSEKFLEVHDSKKYRDKSKKTPKEHKLSPDMEIAAMVVTRARVEKIINKMVDDGIIPENWGRNEVGIIMKNAGRLVYEDCLKEEPEIVAGAEDFGKACSNTIVKVLKQIVLDR
ncbi:MAG: RNA ligase family protein [Oscillospiraceae bacterium]